MPRSKQPKKETQDDAWLLQQHERTTKRRAEAIGHTEGPRSAIQTAEDCPYFASEEQRLHALQQHRMATGVFGTDFVPERNTLVVEGRPLQVAIFHAMPLCQCSMCGIERVSTDCHDDPM